MRKFNFLLVNHRNNLLFHTGKKGMTFHLLRGNYATASQNSSSRRRAQLKRAEMARNVRIAYKNLKGPQLCPFCVNLDGVKYCSTVAKKAKTRSMLNIKNNGLVHLRFINQPTNPSGLAKLPLI